MLSLASIVFFAFWATLALYAYAVEPNWLRVRHRVVRVDGLDPALRGTRILHLSDLHIGSADRRLARFLRRAARVQADLIVITGDFLGSSPPADHVKGMLRPLTANGQPVVGVPGNHEHRYHTYRWPSRGRWYARHNLDTADVLRTLTEAGVHMLVNESCELNISGATLTLAGTDEDLGGHDDLDKTLSGLDPRSVILLTHSPDLHDEASRRGIPLVLSGHTHGGQVRLGSRLAPFTNTRYRPKHSSGILRKGKTMMHLSPGLATTHIPFRFLCRPEVTVLELRGA